MLLVCPLYSNLRTEFFQQRWLCRHICNQLFYDIMSTKNNTEIFCLSKFIYKAFKEINISKCIVILLFLLNCFQNFQYVPLC